MPPIDRVLIVLCLYRFMIPSHTRTQWRNKIIFEIKFLSVNWSWNVYISLSLSLSLSHTLCLALYVWMCVCVRSFQQHIHYIQEHYIKTMLLTLNMRRQISKDIITDAQYMHSKTKKQGCQTQIYKKIIFIFEGL